MVARIVLLVLVVLFSFATSFISANDCPPGKETVLVKCSGCHGSALVFQRQYPRKEWQKVIKRMEKHGLQISGKDKKEILRYLAAGCPS